MMEGKYTAAGLDINVAYDYYPCEFRWLLSDFNLNLKNKKGDKASGSHLAEYVQIKDRD